MGLNETGCSKPLNALTGIKINWEFHAIVLGFNLRFSNNKVDKPDLLKRQRRELEAD